MMRFVKVFNRSTLSSHPIHAAVCDSFWLKFRGLMFRKNLDEYSGILLAERTDSRIASSIHMFCMGFDIAVIWINSQYKVVDAKIARRWRPMYFPKKPAQFVLETHVNRMMDFYIGDSVEIKNGK